MYNLEHGQLYNVAKTERLRSDLYELTCKVARMAGTMEEMQDKWYAKEKAQTYEKAKKKLETHIGSKETERERRQVRDPGFKTPPPEERHRGGQEGDRSRRRMG